ncbi:hypothetical protein Y032_0043g883 [Ancylostoma ceylanicum]|uniref:Uncharacterized protein n=1 Tax=Ancylostoma ceylanicum TaxID=53326 RepID=A0A016UFM5_9BILA|nr:hypothetical protein Y032_0043g883 [Ancylostoma ceylanicum]
MCREEARRDRCDVMLDIAVSFLLDCTSHNQLSSVLREVFCLFFVLMTAIPHFQTGEIITFYMLGFTILMTASVVVYYKFLSPSKSFSSYDLLHCSSSVADMSGRGVGNLMCKSGRGQKMAKCEELMSRFVRRRRS